MQKIRELAEKKRRTHNGSPTPDYKVHFPPPFQSLLPGVKGEGDYIYVRGNSLLSFEKGKKGEIVRFATFLRRKFFFSSASGVRLWTTESQKKNFCPPWKKSCCERGLLIRDGPPPLFMLLFARWNQFELHRGGREVGVSLVQKTWMFSVKRRMMTYPASLCSALRPLKKRNRAQKPEHTYISFLAKKRQRFFLKKDWVRLRGLMKKDVLFVKKNPTDVDLLRDDESFLK